MSQKRRKACTVAELIRDVHGRVVYTLRDGESDVVVDRWSFVVRSWLEDALSLHELAQELRARWRVYQNYRHDRGLPAAIDSCPLLPLRAPRGRSCCSTGLTLIALKKGTATRLERHLKVCTSCRSGIEHFLCAELTQIVQAAVADIRQQEFVRAEVVHARRVLCSYYERTQHGGRWVRRQMYQEGQQLVVPEPWLIWYRSWWAAIGPKIRQSL